MKKRKSWIKSRSKKILALYYWGKCLGVNPLSLSKQNKMQYSWTSLFYGCFLIMTYCYTYYRLLLTRFTMILPEETPISIIVNFLALSWQFFETLSAWFVFAIHQNGIKIIIKKFLTAGKTSEKLGIPDDWDKILKEFGAHLLLNNILYLISVIISHRMWHTVHGSDQLLWIKFWLPVIASFNTKMTFVWCLILVRRKFRRLNEMIKCLMENGPLERNGTDQRLMKHSSFDSDPILSRINMISQLHHELREIINHVEEHFASLILFSIGNGLTYFTLNVYRMYRYIKGQPKRAEQLTYFGALSHWMIYPAALLIVISNVCGSTMDEANNTGCVLHELLNKSKYFYNVQEASKFNTLSLNLLKNHVSMSVWGLLKLDHFLLYRTVGTSTTYLIIMLQLYN